MDLDFFFLTLFLWEGRTEMVRREVVDALVDS